MKNEIILQLAREQEKLHAIDRLSNHIQKIDDLHMKNEIAYLIHQICEAGQMTSDLFNKVAGISIQAHKDIFVQV